MPSKILDYNTPIERLNTLFSNFSSDWGTTSKNFQIVPYVHIHGYLRGKLDPRPFHCFFPGIPLKKKRDTSVIIHQLENSMLQGM